jgi:hypothetical protein
MQIPASFGEAERLLKAGTRLSPEQLASLLERNPETALPDVLRTYIVGTLRRQPSLPAGRRKTRISARRDFLMADAIDLYEMKLRECSAEHEAESARARAKGDILPKTRLPAHERAARAVVEKMKAELGSMSSKRLLNSMSEIKKREVPEEDEMPPDD